MAFPRPRRSIRSASHSEPDASTLLGMAKGCGRQAGDSSERRTTVLSCRLTVHSCRRELKVPEGIKGTRYEWHIHAIIGDCPWYSVASPPRYLRFAGTGRLCPWEGN